MVSGVTVAWEERERLAALRRYGILDTPPEPEFDDVVRLAAHICRTPIALMTLIDERRQWFKAEFGLGRRETPLELSICTEAILQPETLVVPDASQDERFRHNPLVCGEPHLRFYAGAPLVTPDGYPLGAVCVLDTKPRDLSDEEAFALRTLAREVMAQLELRRAVAEREEVLAARAALEHRQALLVRELHHRIGNTFGMIQGLLGSMVRSSHSIPEFYRAFSARMASLARTQKLLTENLWQAAPLDEMVEQELRLYLEQGPRRVVMNGPRLELPSDLAVPVGMALHELASNAGRHGALSISRGWVEITWDVKELSGARHLRLSWREHDGPPVRKPEHSGFGSNFLNRVLPFQSNAEVDVSYKPDGVAVEIETPLSQTHSG